MQKRTRRECGLLGLKLSKPTKPDFGKARALCVPSLPQTTIAPKQDAPIYSTKVLAGGCLLLLLHRKSRSSALPNSARKVPPELPSLHSATLPEDGAMSILKNVPLITREPKTEEQRSSAVFQSQPPVRRWE